MVWVTPRTRPAGSSMRNAETDTTSSRVGSWASRQGCSVEMDDRPVSSTSRSCRSTVSVSCGTTYRPMRCPRCCSTGIRLKFATARFTRRMDRSVACTERPMGERRNSPSRTDLSVSHCTTSAAGAPTRNHSQGGSPPRVMGRTRQPRSTRPPSRRRTGTIPNHPASRTHTDTASMTTS